MIYFTKTIYGERVVLCGNRFIIKEEKLFVLYDADNIKSITHIEKELCEIIGYHETIYSLLGTIEEYDSHDEILQYLN